jgi:hypothetical protein
MDTGATDAESEQESEEQDHGTGDRCGQEATGAGRHAVHGQSSGEECKDGGDQKDSDGGGIPSE